MIKPYECTQCGSTDFLDVETGRVRCANCGSLFELLTNEPRVVISKGANVVFGKDTKVEIRGDLQVQDGADVNIEGRVTVISDGRQREFRLKKIE